MGRILIATFMVFMITVGGWFIFKEAQKKELLAANVPRIEKFLRYNYEDVSTVTFTKNKVSPMGVPSILGYVNNNKDMSFRADVYKKHFEGALDLTGVTPINRTDSSFEYGFKSVSDIEKEEAQQK